MDTKSNNIPEYSPVCMIYSQLSLKELEDLFTQYGDDGSQHGPLRVVRAKDDSGQWRDTNRTIVLISERLFDRLIADGLYQSVRTPGRSSFDFRIVPYEVRENNLPKPGLKKDLFIRLPKNSDLDINNVKEIIYDKMTPLVKFGVIKANQFSIKVPLRNKDRSTGVVSGACFVTFSKEVTDHQAALVKAVIDDTYWGTSIETFHCYWARDQVEVPKPPPKPKQVATSGKKEEPEVVGLDKDGNKAFYKSEVATYVPKKIYVKKEEK